MRKTFTGADRDIALADIKLGLKIYQEMMEVAKMGNNKIEFKISKDGDTFIEKNKELTEINLYYADVWINGLLKYRLIIQPRSSIAYLTELKSEDEI